jgi:hypothetical protein
MTTETVQATDFILVVDNLDGLRAYRVTHFEVDTVLAVLRPVFLVKGEETRLRNFSSLATFRLVNPDTKPVWQYESALRLVRTSFF